VENPFHDEWCYCLDRCCRQRVVQKLWECVGDLAIPIGGDLAVCLETCILSGQAWCAGVCAVAGMHGLAVWLWCGHVVEGYSQSCNYALQRCLGQIVAQEGQAPVGGVPVGP